MSETIVKLPQYEVHKDEHGLYVRPVGKEIWAGPYESTNDLADAVAMWVNADLIEAFPDVRVR